MTGLTELVARRGAAGGRASGAPERRAVRLVQALLLLESAMYSALAPVLPHYERLLHAAKPAMGILNASYPAGLVPGSFLAAWAAARLGVRRATLLGLVLFAAAIAPFGWATGEVALDALRFAQGLACGFIWIGGLTWVIGVAERERRGEVLGTVFAAAIFGTLVGPILGTLAIAAGTGPVFAAVALASLALARWTASHPQPPLGAERERSPRLRAMLANRRISLGGWLILLEAGTVGAVSTLVPLRLAALGAAEALIGATFLIAALLSTQMSRPIGRITDRHGPRRPLRAGLIATAVLMVLLTLPRS
ncbi:MAG TPA: MFS transporter, partial [Solirubrobacteraceae bacterium]|nr:MFS transporter [Solirubrobacteraceae bacterium]